MRLGVIAIIAGMCIAPRTFAQTSVTVQSDQPRNSNPVQERARLIHKLLEGTATINLENVSARQAFTSLRTAADVPIVARFSDDAVGFGIDPETVISINALNEPTIDVLENILAQCSKSIECTWQIRRGFVEVGTKARLSVPAARETRIYEIRDLMIEAPDFDSGQSRTVREFRQAISNAGEDPLRPTSGRMQPLALAVNVVQEIVETIEPDHWDFGQPMAPVDDDRIDPDNLPAQTEPSNNEPKEESSSPAAAQPSGQLPRVQADVKMWASIRIWRDQLIVVAPDFIHRQVGGYPEVAGTRHG